MTELPPLVFTPEDADEHNRLYDRSIDCYLPMYLSAIHPIIDVLPSALNLELYGVGRFQTLVCIPNEEFRRWCADNDHQFFIHQMWEDAVSILVSEKTAMMIKLTFDMTDGAM